MEWDMPDDGSDENAYPAAPVPSHERAWRHPSEVGEAAWVLSEPPLALGRGLMVTTGVIGCALGLAILWLLVPSTGSEGDRVAAPSVTRSAVLDGGPDSELGPTATLGATFAPGSSIRLPESSFGGEGDAAVISSAPSGSVALMTMHTIALQSSGSGAIAVMVEDLGLAMTTEAAVADSPDLMMTFEGGQSASATVAYVESGLAFIQPDISIPAMEFAHAATAQPGETLRVLTAVPVDIVYSPDVATDLDDDGALGSILEGTPVVNADGALVGLCTKSKSGLTIMPVPMPPAVTLPGEDPDTADTDPPTSGAAAPSTTADATGLTSSTSTPSTTASPSSAPASTVSTPSTTAVPSGIPLGSSAPTTTTPKSSTTTTPSTSTTTTVAAPGAWLGVHVGNVAGASALSITSVSTGSPAASVGLAVGDRLVSADGVRLTTKDDLVATLQGKGPGDVVSFVVARDGQLDRTVSVTLAAAPESSV